MACATRSPIGFRRGERRDENATPRSEHRGAARAAGSVLGDENYGVEQLRNSAWPTLTPRQNAWFSGRGLGGAPGCRGGRGLAHLPRRRLQEGPPDSDHHRRPVQQGARLGSGKARGEMRTPLPVLSTVALSERLAPSSVTRITELNNSVILPGGRSRRGKTPGSRATDWAALLAAAAAEGWHICLGAASKRGRRIRTTTDGLCNKEPDWVPAKPEAR